jgi:hypothetical protein
MIPSTHAPTPTLTPQKSEGLKNHQHHTPSTPTHPSIHPSINQSIIPSLQTHHHHRHHHLLFFPPTTALCPPAVAPPANLLPPAIATPRHSSPLTLSEDPQAAQSISILTVAQISPPEQGRCTRAADGQKAAKTVLVWPQGCVWA